MKIVKILSICFFILFLTFATLFIREKNLEVKRVDQIIEQASSQHASNTVELSGDNTALSEQKILLYEIVCVASLITSIVLSAVAFRRKT
ncbi:hypothetical protein SB717_27345 [Priestia sp. SIMBA_032]|uniref:hypothetical protein n=1 Tax=Priestia sp. SIMBA_032 TaxID=3085775 RepID=UPI00397AE05D